MKNTGKERKTDTSIIIQMLVKSMVFPIYIPKNISREGERRVITILISIKAIIYIK